MAPPSQHPLCLRCGGHTVRPLQRPARTVAYRVFAAPPLPADFPMPTCTRCRADCLDLDTTQRFHALLPRLYQAELRRLAARELHALSPHISQRQLELLAGLAQGYLSRLQWQHFGSLLRDRRNAAKFSRLTLGHQAKLSDATIKFVETARHPPSRSTLIRLLSVAELHLTWADVPGSQAPPAPKRETAVPSTQTASDEPAPDPAQFLMNLIGFDEIRLPPGASKTLRIFQAQIRKDGHASDSGPKDEPES